MQYRKTRRNAAPRRFHRIGAIGSLLAAAQLLAACGGGGSADPAPVTPAPTPAPSPAPTPDPVLETPPSAPAPSLPSTPDQQRLPSPPAQLQLPLGVDTSRPGVAVRPVTATSSETANLTNTAAKAVDGDGTTRWESAHVDDAWIQFDFGAKTQLGYMKLVWENAYGKEYVVEVSDDGATWYQLRYVMGGQGGTEEFFNLNANVRYVRLQGVARATQYGYSLFEVEFKSPGSDNSIGRVSTTAAPFPPNGGGLVSPAPAPAPARGIPVDHVR